RYLRPGSGGVGLILAWPVFPGRHAETPGGRLGTFRTRLADRYPLRDRGWQAISHADQTKRSALEVADGEAAEAVIIDPEGLDLLLADLDARRCGRIQLAD